MSEIRAAALEPGKVEIRSFPRSPVPPDGLIVKILQCGVCGSDKHMLAGHLKLPFPIVPGHELVGEVVEIGPQANDTLFAIGGPLKEGDLVTVTPSSKVCGKCWFCVNVPTRPTLCTSRLVYGFRGVAEPPHVWGAFAEYMYVHGRSWVYKLPADISRDRAMLAEPMAIALRGVEKAYTPGMPTMREGLGVARSCVVVGVGPIGLMTVTALKYVGAGPIVAIAFQADRLEMAKVLGADVIINGKELPEAERLDMIRSLTEGVGADVVFETAGVPVAFAEALQIARRGGKVIELGHYTDPGSVAIHPHLICNKDLDVHGSWSTPPIEFRSALTVLQNAQGPLEKLITHRYPLDDIAEAIDSVGKEGVVKTAVLP